MQRRGERLRHSGKLHRRLQSGELTASLHRFTQYTDITVVVLEVMTVSSVFFGSAVSTKCAQDGWIHL